jgi:hypothetical protein
MLTEILMKLSVAVIVVGVICGCSISGGTAHMDVKVKAVHAWEPGRAKNCMLLTGNPAIEGGKATPDPKEMWCNDQRKVDPDDMQWDYIHVSTVRLDAQGQKTFNDRHHFAVPLICEKVSSTQIKCVFDGTAPEKF